MALRPPTMGAASQFEKQMNFFQKLKSDCAQLSLNCRQASRAQSEQMDHPLPRATRLGLWLHLLLCKWCRRYGRQIRFLRESAHAHEEEFTKAGPPQLSAQARERIKQRLQQGK
jgi:hypothetical protein